MNSPTVEEEVPLVGTDADAVLSAVRGVLSKTGVVSLRVIAGDSIIRYQRLASDDEIAANEFLTYASMLRARPMEEYLPEDGVDAYRQLFEMFDIITDAGFIPTIVLSGCTIPKLREKWLPLISRKAKSVFGVPIVVEEGIPEDNIIVCGSDRHSTGPETIRYSVKVSLP